MYWSRERRLTCHSRAIIETVDEVAEEVEEIVAALDLLIATTVQGKTSCLLVCIRIPEHGFFRTMESDYVFYVELIAPAVTRAHDPPPEIAVIAAVTAAAPDVVVRTADPAQDPLDPDPALALALLAAARLLPVDVATADRPRPDAVRLPLAAALPRLDVALPLLVIALPQEAEALETVDLR